MDQGEPPWPDWTGPDSLEQLGPAAMVSFHRVRANLQLGEEPKPYRIGGFEIRKPLGEGGMGVVYLAHDPKLGREVALKLIQTRLHLSHETLRARLLREGRALAQLRHPNVVSVHASGEHEDEPYLVMEYAAGDTLRAWQRERPRSRDQILQIYIEAGRGLAAAHAAEIVHRDFKPDNVLVSADGRAQVSDFGLADLLQEPAGALAVTAEGDGDASGRLTHAGEVLGTRGYVAPEQLQGDAADARSDQFAYCVALWEALTGQLPFPQEHAAALLAAILANQPVGGEALPRWLRRLLRTGLAGDPERRHRDMTELVDALQRGRERGGRWLIGGALSLAAVLSVGSLIFAANQQPSEPPPCALQSSLDDPPNWQPLQKRLGVEALKPLERQLAALERRAAGLCRNPDLLRAKHAMAWLEDLRGLLASTPERSTEHVYEHIDRLLTRSWRQPPIQPITDTVAQALAQADERELANDLDDARVEVDEALAASESWVDHAEVQLRLGRLLTLQNDYPAAEQAYRQAIVDADAGSDDDGRLLAGLLAAELAIKRLDRPDLAEPYLITVEGALTRIDESPLSFRRAQYLNLQATVSRHQGHIDAALRTQRLALALLIFNRAPPHLLARSLASLGVFHEVDGEVDAAKRCYRRALELAPASSPDHHHVAFTLGNFLAEHADDDAGIREAHALLHEAGENRPELRLAALNQRLRLILEEGDSDERTANLDTLSKALAQQLDTGGGKPSHRYEAWQTLSFVYAADPPPSSRFDRAVAQTYALARDQEQDPLGLARFELTVAGFSSDDGQCRDYAEKARARLERIAASPESASPECDAMLQDSQDLLAELSGD